ncbi:hypothetical protein ACIPYQ_13045 [Streptomyces sp. NPDC090045]|uniref:hypothetical protein n=1 Tax=Streptomyces sp. NPDC090045 TaxID=3365927 RepID=UPI003811AB04
MQGSLMFVHGTGVREGLEHTLQQVRAGASKWLDLPSASVSGPAWGQEIGPADLDVTPILPPAARTRAALEEEALDDSEVDVAAWGLLIDDPLIELRMLAAAPAGATGAAVGQPEGIEAVIGGQTVEVEVQELLNQVEVPAETLRAAGVTDQEITAAIEFVRGSEALLGAAQTVGNAADEGLLESVSRSVVACVLRLHRTASPPVLSPVSVSGELRTQLVDAVNTALSGTPTRAFVADTLWKTLGPLALRIGNAKARKNRAALMDPISDFIRDVAFYLRRGEAIRQYLAASVSDLPSDRPVIVVGHSLGGIAMVDLMSSDEAPHVDLLVTVGSQAPYLYLLDALESLRPGGNGKPFTPWLNIYSQADFLSFCAAPAFDGIDGISDQEVAAGVPFPESHSAYWSQEKTYTLIAEHWP